MVKKNNKPRSMTPTLIVLGSLVLTIGLANPMLLISGLFIVWIFGDKL